MFMMPVTVPLNWPPTSMGTAQAGPITNSRKKNEAARQRTEVTALCGHRGGNHEDAGQKKPGRGDDAAREPGVAGALKNQIAERAADDISDHSREQRNRPQMPSACSVRWRCSRK